MKPTNGKQGNMTLSEHIRLQGSLASRAGQMATLEDIATQVGALETEVERMRAVVEVLCSNQDDVLASLRFSAMRYEQSGRPGVAKDLERLTHRLETVLDNYQEAT